MNKFSVIHSKGNARPMFRLALPALAEEFLVLMVTWTDWWLAGHYIQEVGDATKTAMTLMGYVMWLIPSMYAAVAIGATALIARNVGSGLMKQANQAANQALLIGVFFAALMTGIAAVFGYPFIRLMQLEPDSAEFAFEYFSYVFPVIPLVMCTQVGAACLRGAGDTVTGFVAKFVVVVLNIIISAGLVTGYGPFPELGWKGIAIGTAIGHAVGGLILLSVLMFGRAGLRWRLRWLKPNWSVIVKILKVGLPGGIDIATLLFSQMVFLAIINSLGKSATAAHGLAVIVEACAFLPAVAFQVATATMVGQFLGAKKPERATGSAVLCLICGEIIMCTAAVVLYLFGPQIASFFTGDITDPTTLMAAELLRIVAIALPFLAVVIIWTGSLRGAGDTVWPLLFTIIGFMLIRIPLSVLFCFEAVEIPIIGTEIQGLGLGIQGAWYAMVIDLVCRGLMVAARFFQGGWRQIKL